MTDCCICFTEIESKGSIECTEKCTFKVCKECIQSVLEFCKKENNICKCFNPKCIGEYTISCFKNETDKELYSQLCFNFVKNDISFNIDKIQKEKSKEYKKIIKKENDTIIKGIFNQKNKTIQENFPESIKLIISICFKERLRKVDSSNLKKIIKGEKIKSCNGHFCTGILNSSGQCNSCYKTFCSICDDVFEVDHKCSKESLETKEIMKKTTKCPTCKVPVEKISGCNNITCAVCGTNFDYLKGVPTIHGNHDKLFLKLNHSNSLSKIFDSVNKIESGLILNFEKKVNEYTTVDKTKIYKINDPIKLSKMYEKYIISKNYMINYTKIRFIMITEFEKNNKISKETFENIENFLKK